MNGHKKILFVDDEVNILNSLRRTLRPVKEWETFFAHDAAEAEQVVAEITPDIIVTDYNMPGRNGIELIASLKRSPQTANIPVVVLTGNAENDLKRKALENGAIDLLNKPLSKDELIARIKNVLILKEYEDMLREQNCILEDRVLQRTLELDYLRKDIIWRLAQAGELRDKETGNHVTRVAHFCRILAEAHSLPEDVVTNIFIGSTLHDLGKIGIPDAVLLKPGKLTAEEFEIMKRHSDIGADLLDETTDSLQELTGIPYDKSISVAIHDELRRTASSIARTHHEKWDGSGYPRGLKGEEIPIEGRITAIADVYDALRSDRPYKKAFSLEKTIEIIKEGRGTHFDPELVDHFLAQVDEFENIRSQYRCDEDGE